VILTVLPLAAGLMSSAYCLFSPRQSLTIAHLTRASCLRVGNRVAAASDARIAADPIDAGAVALIRTDQIQLDLRIIGAQRRPRRIRNESR
jgi:hypothetical protein